MLRMGDVSRLDRQPGDLQPTRAQWEASIGLVHRPGLWSWSSSVPVTSFDGSRVAASDIAAFQRNIRHDANFSERMTAFEANGTAAVDRVAKNKTKQTQNMSTAVC